MGNYAERIFRLAFGILLGAPEPETFWSDRDYVRGRWQHPTSRLLLRRLAVNW